jgi:hypothetical protein
MSLQVTEAKILRATLLSIPEVVSLVTSPSGIVRVFWQHVPEEVEWPFIVFSHITGGLDHDAKLQASDTWYKVVGQTANMEQAEALANAIGKLHRINPVSTISGVCGYTWITEMTPVFDRINLQNFSYFVVGGIYRLRLSLGVV